MVLEVELESPLLQFSLTPLLPGSALGLSILAHQPLASLAAPKETSIAKDFLGGNTARH